MGRQRPKGGKRTAYIHAGLDDENELHVQSGYRASPEKTMATLIRTAEKWVSLTTSKASTVGQTLKPPLQPPRADPAAPSATASIAPHKIFSFLDALPPEDSPDEDVLRTMTKEEKEFYLAQNSEARAEIATGLREMRKVGGSAPLRFRVLRSRLPTEVKRRILSKLEKQNESLTPGDSVKYNTWVEVLLALPLGEVVVPQPNLPVADAMARAKAHLEGTVFGHRAAKGAILERFYMWLVAPFALQRPVALCGVPGNGKTTLVREGLAAIMARPFAFISLGGSVDSSSLLGHSYTYEGSTPGRIAEHLIASRCVNPIFYFDELDKCSATPKGEEIINALVHFTDPAQSDKFRDRYVGDVDIDTSRSLCVFSFNDASQISPILLDRLQIVETDEFDSATQAKIAEEHLVPQVMRERGVEAGKITFAPEALQWLARMAPGGGVRCLKSVLEQATSKVALWRDAPDPDFLLPLRPSDVERLEDSVRITAGLDRLLEAMQKSKPPPTGMYM